jgi:hypothetical protein
MRAPRCPYRFFIVSGKDFNNYFLLQYYLDEIVTASSHLYTFPGSNLAEMVSFYAGVNNCMQDTMKPLEPFDLTRRRNAVWDVVRLADMLIIFQDSGKPLDHETALLKEAFESRKKRVTIHDVFPGDRVKNAPLSKPGGEPIPFADLYGRFMPENNLRPSEYAMLFLERMRNSSEMLKTVLENATRPILTATPQEKSATCLLTWVVENQLDALQDMYLEFTTSSKRIKFFKKDDRIYREAPPSPWKEKGDHVPVYTATGLEIATGYSGTKSVGDETYLLIQELDILRNHVHRPISEPDEEEDEDSASEIFATSEAESYPIIHRTKELGKDPFPSGFWCINVKYVTLQEPYKDISL